MQPPVPDPRASPASHPLTHVTDTEAPTSTRRSPARFSFDREQRITGDLEQVFRFFADPRSLEAITPPWLRLRLLESSTPELREGTTIAYASGCAASRSGGAA